MNLTEAGSLIVATCAALVCFITPSDGFAQDWIQTTCDRGANEGQDACDATPFDSANAGSTSAESYHYTTDHTMTSRQFLYGDLGGPGSNFFSLATYANVGEALEFFCDGAVVEFPNGESRDYVTFVFSEFSGDSNGVNFLAVNASGTVIDEATKRAPPQEFEVVTLGPHPRSGSSYDIQKVYMWHVDGTCNIDCAEPVISEVRACDVNFP
jgi:hypothetical protein